jgi:hypothetical protein
MRVLDNNKKTGQARFFLLTILAAFIAETNKQSISTRDYETLWQQIDNLN